MINEKNSLSNYDHNNMYFSSSQLILVITI